MNSSDHPAGFIASLSQRPSEDCHVVRVTDDGQETTSDQVTIEEPLEIRIASKSFEEFTLAITMRTPGHDHELALGFLFGEGIIGSRHDCIQIEHCRPPSTDKGLHNVIRIELNDTVNFSPADLERHFYTSSSCGICGKTSIESVMRAAENKVSGGFHLTQAQLTGLPAQLSARQSEFRKTGGIHASGLINSRGDVITVREDIGRHNAMDKLMGSLLLQADKNLADYGILLSGRASFELLQKATIAGISLVASMGSPSSLAIDLAREKGITLIGFLKNDSFNVYTHPDRLA